MPPVISVFAIPSRDDFSAAASVVKSGAIPHATNDDKLRLYGLYKQATIGPAPGASSASIFDIVGQHKYSAWDKVRNLSADEAKQQYVALVQDLAPGSFSSTELQPMGAPSPLMENHTVHNVLAAAQTELPVKAPEHETWLMRISSRYDGMIMRLNDRLRPMVSALLGESLYTDRSGMSFQIVTLSVVAFIVISFGLVLHMANPSAGDERAPDSTHAWPPPPPPPDLGNASNNPPSMPPSPPPIPCEIEHPDSRVWECGSAEGYGMGWEWWQQRRSDDVMRLTAAWQLLICDIFCCLLPIGWVKYRRCREKRGAVGRRTPFRARVGPTRPQRSTVSIRDRLSPGRHASPGRHMRLDD